MARVGITSIDAATSEQTLPEGILVINTWKNLSEGQFGYHSIEFARLGWGELHVSFRGVEVVFETVTDTNGIKEGYWSIPTY